MLLQMAVKLVVDVVVNVKVVIDVPKVKNIRPLPGALYPGSTTNGTTDSGLRTSCEGATSSGTTIFSFLEENRVILTSHFKVTLKESSR